MPYAPVRPEKSSAFCDFLGATGVENNPCNRCAELRPVKGLVQPLAPVTDKQPSQLAANPPSRYLFLRLTPSRRLLGVSPNSDRSVEDFCPLSRSSVSPSRNGKSLEGCAEPRFSEERWEERDFSRMATVEHKACLVTSTFQRTVRVIVMLACLIIAWRSYAVVSPFF